MLLSQPTFTEALSGTLDLCWHQQSVYSTVYLVIKPFEVFLPPFILSEANGLAAKSRPKCRERGGGDYQNFCVFYTQVEELESNGTQFAINKPIAEKFLQYFLRVVVCVFS